MAAPPDAADAYAVMRAIGAAVAEARAGGDPGEVGWVVELLGSADDWVAASAAEATGPLGLRQAIPQLVRLLASGPDAPPEAITSGEQAYALAAVLTVLSTEAFVNIAWDSAGVTTGPVTVPLVLAMGLGQGDAVGVVEGFGILSMASIGPILAVLATGLWITKARAKREGTTKES